MCENRQMRWNMHITTFKSWDKMSKHADIHTYRRKTNTSTVAHTHIDAVGRQSGVAPWHWSIVSDSLLPLMSEVRWLRSEATTHHSTAMLQQITASGTLSSSQRHRQRHKQAGGRGGISLSLFYHLPRCLLTLYPFCVSSFSPQMHTCKLEMHQTDFFSHTDTWLLGISGYRVWSISSGKRAYWSPPNKNIAFELGSRTAFGHRLPIRLFDSLVRTVSVGLYFRAWCCVTRPRSILRRQL